MIAVTGYFLIRTNSKTSAGTLAVALALGIVFEYYNPRYRALVIASIVIIIGVIITGTVIYWDALIAPFGRPDAFTGRVQIWPPLVSFWHDHWLRGAGYGSFWNVGPDGPIFRYARGWVTKISTGHNGYIDLLAQIGLPGLLLAITGAFVVPVFWLLSSTTIAKQRGSMILAIVIFCAGDNFTESSLLDRDQIQQIFLMISIALLGVAMRAKAPERRPSFAVRYA